MWRNVALLVMAVLAPSPLLAQKPFAEKLHDPATDRAYPLVRDPRLNYIVSALELSGDFYRLRFGQAFVSFGITERGTTEVVVLGSGDLILNPSPEIQKLEVFLSSDGTPGPPRATEAIPEHLKVTSAYIRLHPTDTFLRIPAGSLRPEPDPVRHDQAEAIRRSRFPLYLNEGPTKAIIPPPGLRVIDVETESGDRMLLFDGPNVPRSITRLISKR
ncbi:hypothetical protein D6833_00160 [Candidatus Parcubacteria bacterium]|nr:MAG: hypothetical protein D6833_00160 [Candidatus Parcubacteria bacterium]